MSARDRLPNGRRCASLDFLCAGNLFTLNAPLDRVQWADKARAVRIEDELARCGFPYWTEPRHNNLGQPCPRCGGRDRFSVNTKKQVFNCRGYGGGDVIALVQHLHGLSFQEAVSLLTGLVPPQKPAAGGHDVPGRYSHGAAPNEAADKAGTAAWLWSRREPVSESNAAGLYIRNRRYAGQFPATLGYLPPNGKHPPAVIAAFGCCGEPEPGLVAPPNFITGVHLTRLTPEGEKAPVDPVKITLGPSMGLPIVLAPANDLLAIDITEGIETGLSVLEWRRAGVWVAGAAGRMPRLAESLPA